MDTEVLARTAVRVGSSRVHRAAAARACRRAGARWVVVVVLLAAAACSDVAAEDPAPEVAAVQPSAARPTPPQADLVQEVQEATMPPGAALPDDATCAARVAQVAEDRPVNREYNATPGAGPLPAQFFDRGSHDPRTEAITSRVSGSFTGSTPEILQWASCKWGLDPRVVHAQATTESFRRQTFQGDWSRDAAACAPGHDLGADGRPGWCPESWGILQVRYQYFPAAFPSVIASTSYNADTAYAVWRACYEGYELWLADFAPPDQPYGPGDLWGCVGRWFSGEWHTPLAEPYIQCVQAHLHKEQCSRTRPSASR